MRFWDEIEIVAQGGNGGNGLMRFRREAHIPMGGPDGGDGGRGGAVVFVADLGTSTFVDISMNRTLLAEDGHPGEENRKTGRDGESTVIKVPVGCQVYFGDRLVADLSVPGARWIAARGGHGGKGNAFFKSSTNQAPEYSQPGQPGERIELKLVLKSVADVGLIGLPNVGKSTLLSTITAARPKIGSYPFTTLIPHLGVLQHSDTGRITIADIPGLIPGAHTGKGLGIQFLKHVERTKILLHLVDASTTTDNLPPLTDESTDEEITSSAEIQFRAIDRELELFSDTLRNLPRIVVFSKLDLPVCARAYELCKNRLIERGFQVIGISSADESGLLELQETVIAELKRHSGETSEQGISPLDSNAL